MSGSGDPAEPARTVAWSLRALNDLEKIGDYIARDNPSAASKWVTVLMQRATEAAPVPYAGRTVPEFGRDDIREVFVRTYRIVYRVEPTRIVVLSVFEGHRQLQSRPDDE